MVMMLSTFCIISIYENCWRWKESKPQVSALRDWITITYEFLMVFLSVLGNSSKLGLFLKMIHFRCTWSQIHNKKERTITPRNMHDFSPWFTNFHRPYHNYNRLPAQIRFYLIAWLSKEMHVYIQNLYILIRFSNAVVDPNKKKLIIYFTGYSVYFLPI